MFCDGQDIAGIVNLNLTISRRDITKVVSLIGVFEDVDSNFRIGKYSITYNSRESDDGELIQFLVFCL